MDGDTSPDPQAQMLGRRIKQIDERLGRIGRDFETAPAYGMKSRFIPNGQRQIDVRKERLLDERAGLIRQLASERETH